MLSHDWSRGQSHGTGKGTVSVSGQLVRELLDLLNMFPLDQIFFPCNKYYQCVCVHVFHT